MQYHSRCEAPGRQNFEVMIGSYYYPDVCLDWPLYRGLGNKAAAFNDMAAAIGIQ